MAPRIIIFHPFCPDFSVGRPTLHISGPVNDTRQEVKSLRQGVMGCPPEEVVDIVGGTSHKKADCIFDPRQAAQSGSRNLETGEESAIYGKIFMGPA